MFETNQTTHSCENQTLLRRSHLKPPIDVAKLFLLQNDAVSDVLRIIGLQNGQTTNKYVSTISELLRVLLKIACSEPALRSSIRSSVFANLKRLNVSQSRNVVSVLRLLQTLADTESVAFVVVRLPPLVLPSLQGFIFIFTQEDDDSPVAKMVVDVLQVDGDHSLDGGIEGA
eukprot:GHVU01191213.1.p1 GENE.GHVU01191213.1~~GHVU01191213.1.p1  ORF type:complete len:172 (+),score=12.07 GHVU01191213.1:385-900(+)